MSEFYIFVLSSRSRRHFTVDVSADLENGVRRLRNILSWRLGRRTRQRLVYVEVTESMEYAIDRTRELMTMSGSSLARVVEATNPGWDALPARRNHRVAEQGESTRGFRAQQLPDTW